MNSRVPRLGAIVALIVSPCMLQGQLLRDRSVDWLMSAGSEGERYLRALQVAGMAPIRPWSIREFSAAETARLAPSDSNHPWAGRLMAETAQSIWVRPLAPDAGVVFNSNFPYGLNDGPVWAGRGLTVMAAAGFEGAVGPFEFRIAPQLFRAQNASFPIAPNGFAGPRSFGDVRFPSMIDLPQRFGDRPYQRLDPGQSSARVNLFRLTIGASTANEAWGPAIESPFLLGNNAAGFAHLFAGSDGPLALGPLRVSFRLIAGRLDQTPYSPAAPESGRRSIAGLIGLVQIRQVPGLEIGAGRLLENTWADTGVSIADIVRPILKNPFKKARQRALGGKGDEPDNQLGSFFARWVLPQAGVEVYGEYGREDNAYDSRDLILEPDHDVAYMLGIQRVWKRADGSLRMLRAETFNSRISHLEKVRYQTPSYVHTPVVQGHTQLGQLLGAPGGYGGESSLLEIESITRHGRRSLAWRRFARVPPTYDQSGITGTHDVVHAVTASWLIFHSRVDLRPEATAAYELDRDGRGDAINLRLAVSAQVHGP
jgi:hypothetical protein